MRLYLVQHAESTPEDIDPDRPITPKGRQDTILVAERAQTAGIQVDEIRHSGKTRARQTAGIFAEYLKSSGGIAESPDLGPVDDVQPVGDEITNSSKNVMLVGHLPFMERMAGYLLTGDPDHKVIDFQNAGLVCLKHDGDNWMTDWILTPQLLD